MKHISSLRAALLMAALSSPLAFAEENPHAHNHGHPQTEASNIPSEQGEVMQMDIKKYMQKMQDTMLKMHGLAHKIQQTKNPKEREKFKEEHLQMMGKHMEMMMPLMMQMMMASHGAEPQENTPAPHDHKTEIPQK